ncbi:hypothetical protein ONZ45_g10093 [Pleurotus djamor]|nr:hypothetical protein ONZ45_g10093 [Pleurotus djamor]
MPGVFTDYAAQEAIDEQIAQLETTIRKLKAQRNTYSAVYKLPIDILSLIFVEFRREDIYAEYSGDWVHLLFVCQLWRSVALKTPSFWSMIRVSGFDSPEDSIELSKRSLLQVVCNLQSAYHYEDELWSSAQMIMEESERFEEFSLRFGGSFDCDYAEKLLKTAAQSRAPRLRSLTIEAQYDSPTSRLSRGIPFMDVSSLRCLRLRNVTFPHDIPTLPSLRTLIIDHASRNHGTPLPWIIQFLRQTPNVVEATLSSTSSEGMVHSSIPVPLPHLKRLQIEAYDVRESQLFDYLDSSLPQHLQREASTPLRIKPSKASAPDSSLGRIFGLSLLTAANTPLLQLELPSGNEAMDHLRLCQLLPLSQVTHIIFANGDTSGPWDVLFPMLTHLATIELVSHCDTVLLPLLCSLQPDDTPYNATLKVLSYRRMWFDHIPALEEIPDVDALSQGELNIVLEKALLAQDDDGFRLEASTFASTLALLQGRREMGVPIQEMVIQDCPITERQVEIIERYVEVSWDGIECMNRTD